MAIVIDMSGIPQVVQKRGQLSIDITIELYIQE